MTREEEICEESYTLDGIDNIQDWRYGARWADEHPRKGLVDIEKVFECLDFVFDKYEEIMDRDVREDCRKALLEAEQ